MVKALEDIIAKSSSIVFFGGAGVSTESGIPDFRSQDGLYREEYDYPPETIISHEFFMENTAEFYRFYKKKMLFPNAEPNACHLALARLERAGKLIAINISRERGTEKKQIPKVRLIRNYGLDGDAHAGRWHRQVSLLSYEKIEEFRKKGAQIGLGAFGENLIVEGYDFRNLPVGTRFQCGDVILEMTQIGKECHSHCEIYKRMGECIMPREGVFAVVIQGGKIKKGDILEKIEETEAHID